VQTIWNKTQKKNIFYVNARCKITNSLNQLDDKMYMKKLD
jgi:hypothetical protein